MTPAQTQEWCADCDKPTDDARGVILCPLHASAPDLLRERDALREDREQLWGALAYTRSAIRAWINLGDDATGQARADLVADLCASSAQALIALDASGGAK